jgi:hypothetical protein
MNGVLPQAKSCALFRGMIQQSPPRRHGCLWGCLAVMAVLALPFVLAAGYATWFWTVGYTRDPVLRGVVELVRRDGTAERVLGNNIHIAGMEGSGFSYMWGEQNSAYVVELEGSKGRGALHVVAGQKNGQLNVQSMILDAPDGARYDLMHHSIRPGSNPTTSI